MRVKRVTYDTNGKHYNGDRFQVEFEVGKATFWKDLEEPITCQRLQDFINSVIEDTKTHGKETKVG
jgi:hypothetical protein